MKELLAELRKLDAEAEPSLWFLHNDHPEVGRIASLLRNALPQIIEAMTKLEDCEAKWSANFAATLSSIEMVETERDAMARRLEKAEALLRGVAQFAGGRTPVDVHVLNSIDRYFAQEKP